MGVTVYPRLSELLAERRLSVSALGRQIEERFGLAVNLKSLYRLTQAAPVQRADLEIAGATAMVLGVSLGDLFRIETTSSLSAPAADDALTPAENARLAALFDQRGRVGLGATEQAELEALVAEYGRRLHERQARTYAIEHDLEMAEARARLAANADDALAWWRALESSPTRRRALAEQARRQRAARD